MREWCDGDACAFCVIWSAAACIRLSKIVQNYNRPVRVENSPPLAMRLIRGTILRHTTACTRKSGQ